ncbi:MAG: hypothetical protein LBE08_06290, partial [Bifidobacteriaceae bacterium]|nr:hypothetical protein [Bifidobacteriaceae bacterium]
CAGWESHGVARAVGGVYGADGEWVVTAYAVRYDTGDEIAPAVVWGHRAVLFVDAPPPKSVRIRGEEPTGGGLDGSVIWGGAPPEPSPALALPSVCQPAAGRHRPSPAGHLFGT